MTKLKKQLNFQKYHKNFLKAQKKILKLIKLFKKLKTHNLFLKIISMQNFNKFLKKNHHI